MAVIGEDNKWTLYVVRKSNDPPASDADFTDYSGYTINFRATGSINTLGYFEGTMASVETACEKADIAVGNLIYLMSCCKLVGKYVIDKPVYGSDYLVCIKGFQSSGTEILNRKMQRESYEKIRFDNVLACNILSSTCSSCHGIVVDSAERTILALSSSCHGGDSRWSVGYDYNNRIEAVDKFATISGQEWWIGHGTNDSTPYSDGDCLYVGGREGSVSSTRTYYVSGSNTNAQVSFGGNDTETNANYIIIQGQDQNNQQITSSTYDATGNYSCITTDCGLDGWLAEDINQTQLCIPVTENSLQSLFAQGFIGPAGTGYVVVKIDSERFLIDCCVGSNPSCLLVNCRDCLVTGSDPVCHKRGADIVYDSRSDGTPLRLYVDDTSCFCGDSGHSIRIGNERLNICTPLGGAYLEIDGRPWSSSYAHGDQVLVNDGSWCPDNPHAILNMYSIPSYSNGCICGLSSDSCAYAYCCVDATCFCICNITGSFEEDECLGGTVSGCLCIGYNTNSIQQNGLFTKTIADNTPSSHHMLDLKAQRILLTKKLPIKKIKINVSEPVEEWTCASLGDTITLGDGSELGFTDGVEVRITGFEYAFDGAQEYLQWMANDKETRTYASTDFTYSCEKSDTEGPKQQEPTREVSKWDELTTCYYGAATRSASLGVGRICDVSNPYCPFDAANKQYVDCQIGGSGQWICSGTALCPCYSNYNIVPNGTVAAVGVSGCPWYAGRFGDSTRYTILQNEVGGICIKAVGSDTHIDFNMYAQGTDGCFRFYVNDCENYAVFCGDTKGGDIGDYGEVVIWGRGQVYNDVNLVLKPNGTGDIKICCGNITTCTLLPDQCIDGFCIISANCLCADNNVYAGAYIGGNLGFGCVNCACYADCLTGGGGAGCWEDGVAANYIRPCNSCCICAPVILSSSWLYASNLDTTGSIFVGQHGYFTGCIRPTLNNTYCSGTTTCSWKQGYFCCLIGPTCVHVTDCLAVDGELKAQWVLPWNCYTDCIGTTALRWKKLYLQCLIGYTQMAGDFYPSINGCYCVGKATNYFCQAYFCDGYIDSVYADYVSGTSCVISNSLICSPCFCACCRMKIPVGTNCYG